MGKKSVLRTLGFMFFSISFLTLILVAVTVTVLNIYKPVVKAYVDGKFIGYFTNEAQFDKVYNELASEKYAIDSNVKVYLEKEPIFENTYIRSQILEEQNIYTNLRAEIKTEYTIYNVAVNNETKMTFNTEDEANKYAEDLKKEVSKLTVAINVEKRNELGEITSLETANNIFKDIVDRNKPVVTVPVTRKVTTPTVYRTVSNEPVSDEVAQLAASEGALWPTTTRRLSSTFGYRPEFGDYHTGIDIDGYTGDPIYAYKTGLVTFAGWENSYGYIIRINHGNGLSTWYAHCSRLLVSAGQVVSQGQTIALEGATGWVTGDHLHFEVRVNGVAQNPFNYL